MDGVIHDTHDCSRKGSRCVYGYFSKPQETPAHCEEKAMKATELIHRVDVDRLLGLADQFLEDWAEDAVQAGKRDPDYEERVAEWAALRPVLLASQEFLRSLVEIASFCDGSSDPMAERCCEIARRVIDALPGSVRPVIGELGPQSNWPEFSEPSCCKLTP